MKGLFSPANLITVAGAVSTVIGITAYLTGAANLSVPTLFYGFPIFLAGLALKSSELAPAQKIRSLAGFDKTVLDSRPSELVKLVKDVTRWRYGQTSHLESSLKALDLWDENTNPQLIEIEEFGTISEYGIRLRFNLGGVSIDRWEEKEERLGRFFAKGRRAEVISIGSNQIDLKILPNNNQTQ